MSEQPPSGQPPPSYQPPPPNLNNPLIPQGQQRKNILSGINPRILIGAGIGIVVIVAVLLLASQQSGTSSVNPTQIALEQTITQNAILFITQTFSAITPTIDPQVSALETQNALLAQGATDQSATNQAVLNQPSQTPFIVTSPPQVTIQSPQIITTTPLPQAVQPTQASQVFVVTATPQPQGNNTVQSSGCSRVGDEINVGATSSGACATVSAGTVAGYVSQGLSFSDFITRLDSMCEATVNACYQYRVDIPAIIPASQLPSQRILWGDLGYVAQAGVEERIERLKCEGNTCVYLIVDTRAFQAGSSGRGLLLDQSYPAHQATYSQASFRASTGTVTLGDRSAWVQFQGWNGKDPSSVVHGVIEPGFTLIIPTPFEGTSWTVTRITYDDITTRSIADRATVVTRDNLATDPPLLYIGGSDVPAGFTNDLPARWNSQGG